MTPFFRLVPALVIALLLVGCASSGSVYTDHDPEQSFGAYKQFAWMGDDPIVLSGDRGPSPVMARRIQAAVRAELSDKGFRYSANANSADFVVSISVGARSRVDVREREVVDYYGPHWRWGYQHFRWVTPPPQFRTEVIRRQYTEGSLAIDIFDAKSKSPVWHGVAAKRLTKDELQGNLKEPVETAVKAVLASFPPQ